MSNGIHRTELSSAYYWPVHVTQYRIRIFSYDHIYSQTHVSPSQNIAKLSTLPASLAFHFYTINLEIKLWSFHKIYATVSNH